MFAPTASESVLTFLFAALLKLTVLLALAYAIAFALRRNSAALRHHLWAAAILASLVLPFLIVFLPAWRSKTLGIAAAAITSSAATTSNAAVSTIPGSVVNASSASPIFTRFAVAILLFWSAGFALILLRLLIGLAVLSARSKPLFEDAWMREVLNLSASFKINRPVRLLECRSSLAMPLTCGLVRPVIILPKGAAKWPEDRRRIVLSHELAHIARHDWFLQICAELSRALYWFHPLVWLAAAQLRHESERAADDVVLLSGVAPSLYASQLLDLARTLEHSGRAWSTALAIARPSNLERRFAAMLNPSVNRRHLSIRTKFLIPFLALTLLLPLAALRLTAQNRAGKTSRSIHDPSGAGVLNATIVMSNHDANTIDMTTTNREGNFSFQSLPAGKYELQVYKPGFQTFRQSDLSLDAGREFTAVFTLEVGAITEHVMVVPDNAAKPSVVEKTNGKPSRLQLGGSIEAAKLVTKVQPVYPESAKSAGVQGTVVLHAVIGLDGKPLSLRIMNSQVDPDLARSAVEAVSQWRYTPTLLNGDPIEVDTTITVNYSLAP